MTIEEQFKENLEKWRVHCKEKLLSSMTRDYLDCDAYRNIVNMGTSVLPLIRKEYGKPPEDINKINPLKSLLVNPVKEIVGEDFQIPEWMKAKPSVTAKYTAKWLDENMQEYLKQD